jgi:prepilin-type N-terminal cleavage/methylation domain-containing protein/prepilin-type processing-associated H-X9-DG protein
MPKTGVAAMKPINLNRRRAFTLVELLVVIGVIALLIALLMPALSSSRESANRLKCLNALRNIGQAAQLHANEHDGYFPLAGWHWEPAGGQTDPKGVGDADERRYDYYVDAGVRRPMPVTAALGRSWGVSIRTDSRANLEADLADDALVRHFTCPSQEAPLTGISQRGGEGGWDAPVESTSYVFNEALLGKRDYKPSRPDPVMGHISRVQRPAEVFLAMDGRPRNMTNDNFILVFDVDKDTSFLDFHAIVMQPANGFGKQTLDYFRHRRRMNVVYCDFHADNVEMTDDALAALGVSRGIYP